MDSILAHTASIVAAHVGNTPTSITDVPVLISTVYRALSDLGQPEVKLDARPEPAVPVKKSVFPDYIICLEDGKKLKMLKRHLMSAYNMTPEQYRDRWHLGLEYPMVAPNYAQHRSNLAKKIGLGTQRGNQGTVLDGDAAVAPVKQTRSAKHA